MCRWIIRHTRIMQRPTIQIQFKNSIKLLDTFGMLKIPPFTKTLTALGLTIARILSAHLPKSAHEATFLIRFPCIWWALLHLVGTFEHSWAPTDVHSAHGSYNSTLLVDKSAHEMQRNPEEMFRVGSWCSLFWRTFKMLVVFRHRKCRVQNSVPSHRMLVFAFRGRFCLPVV